MRVITLHLWHHNRWPQRSGWNPPLPAISLTPANLEQLGKSWLALFCRPPSETGSLTPVARYQICRIKTVWQIQCSQVSLWRRGNGNFVWFLPPLRLWATEDELILQLIPCLPVAVVSHRQHGRHCCKHRQAEVMGSDKSAEECEWSNPVPPRHGSRWIYPALDYFCDIPGLPRFRSDAREQGTDEVKEVCLLQQFQGGERGSSESIRVFNVLCPAQQPLCSPCCTAYTWLARTSPPVFLEESTFCCASSGGVIFKN